MLLNNSRYFNQAGRLVIPEGDPAMVTLRVTIDLSHQQPETGLRYTALGASEP